MSALRSAAAAAAAVAMLVASAACTQDDDDAADSPSTTSSMRAGPGTGAQDRVALGPWFLLKADGWALIDGATVADEGAILPMPDSVWFTEYRLDPSPNESRSVNLTLYSRDGITAEGVARSTGRPQPTTVKGKPAFWVLDGPPSPDLGGWLYWQIGPGKVLSLGGSESRLTDIQPLADRVVEVGDAEWKASVEAVRRP